MKKSIAVWAGVGIAAVSQAAFIVHPSETADWMGLSNLWSQAGAVSVSATAVVPVIAKIEFDVDDLVRQLRDHVATLPCIEFGVDQPAEITVEVRGERMVEVDILRHREQVFVYAGKLCPDKPEIPSWAWAWELSTPEGW